MAQAQAQGLALVMAWLWLWRRHEFRLRLWAWFCSGSGPGYGPGSSSRLQNLVALFNGSGAAATCSTAQRCACGLVGPWCCAISALKGCASVLAAALEQALRLALAQAQALAQALVQTHALSLSERDERPEKCQALQGPPSSRRSKPFLPDRPAVLQIREVPISKFICPMAQSACTMLSPLQNVSTHISMFKRKGALSVP